jgi:hypothetical protein
MRLSPLTSLAATIALTAGLLSPAHAVLVPGKKNSCAAVWDTGPANAVISSTGKPSTLTCTDGDPTCDADGLPNGTCIINLNVCTGEATPGCTPTPLTAPLTFNAPISKKNILGSVFHAPPVSPAGCGLAGTMSLALKVPKNPKKKTKPSKPVTLVMKDKGFVNKLKVQCVPSGTTPTVAVCPSRGGMPSQITFTVPGTGSDLDNGWTGISHNFPIINGSQLRYCLSGCDGTSTFDCTGSGATGTGSLNGATFGAPLPLLAANTPVCVVNRYMPNETLQGTFNLQTGVSGTSSPNGNLVSLFSDVYLRTTFPEVCPRCVIPGGGGDIGSVGKCSGTAKTPGADCRVDGKVVVAGQGLYLLSSACVPLGDSPPTSLDIELPLTTGTAKTLVGPKPCPDSAGAQTQDDNCGSAACNAGCTGTACVSHDADGNCIDAKGGISQFCCANNTSLPCFPTSAASKAAGLGSIVRTGKPVIPGGAQGTFAGTFCIAHTDSNLINTVTGLPGPGALLLPSTAVVSK